VHLTALAAAFAFYKIDKTAGYWMLPYALWTGKFFEDFGKFKLK
jgi:tryptophan-rich sensory protein